MPVHLSLEEEEAIPASARPRVSQREPFRLDVEFPGRRERRQRELKRAALLGVRRRAQMLSARTVEPAGRSGGEPRDVLRPLPRREFASAEAGAGPSMPSPRSGGFQASAPETLRRVLVWLRVMLAFVLGDLLDKLRGKSSLERRAHRLHDLFQSAGGTFTKLGQQLSMRIDILPYEYCRELGKLLDTVPPMAVERAVAEIERATGRPLRESFAAFDPQPIGSASIACVYQAVLKDGRKVAVKVRRPEVGRLFASDLRALAWLVDVAEALAIFRPGYAQNIVLELRSTFMEELDFEMEAAYQTLFRREARRGRLARRGFVSAPRVVFELSSNAVLVQEYISGIWMWEIMAAVENKDPVAAARMRELKIDPKVLSRRMQRANMWGQVICDIYHADPHPANILVQEGHKLVFVDFGACGSTNRVKRGILRDLLYYQVRRDIQGVVRSMLSFMEPLPPIDLNQFEKRTEMLVGQVLHKVWSEHAPWHEKTSAALFYRFFEAARQYHIPVNVDTVRSFRASMLYDTLALRIDPTLDIHRENRRFNRMLQRDRQRKMRKALRKRLSEGLLSGPESTLLEELAEVSARGVKVLRQELDKPRFNFAPMVEKPVFAVVETVRLVAIASALSVASVLGAALLSSSQGLAFDIQAAARAVGANPYYWVILSLVSIVSVRRVMLRLMDMKV